MLSFAAAALILVITPGPGVLSAAGVGSSFGYQAGTTYVAGLILGVNIVAAIVASGLSAIVLALPMLREVLLVSSAIYLTYLATRIAAGGRKSGFASEYEDAWHSWRHSSASDQSKGLCGDNRTVHRICRLGRPTCMAR